jgi:hypothetical protein
MPSIQPTFKMSNWQRKYQTGKVKNSVMLKQGHSLVKTWKHHEKQHTSVLSAWSQRLTRTTSLAWNDDVW